MTSAPPRTTNPWLVLSILAAGLFVTGVNSTSVNTAIPAIGAGLPATFTELLWIVNVYSLVMAVLVIIAGRLGDLYGPKRIFILGLTVFATGSLLCGTAATPLMLTAGRLVQGAGAALCSPQSLAVISRIFPPEKRGAATGFWGAIAGAAVAAGPSIGGLLVDAWGWRSMFLVNVPVCLLAAVLAAVLVPEVGAGRRHRLDWLGSGLAAAGLFGVSFGLLEGPSHHWGRVAGPITSPMVIVAGVATLGAFLVVERSRQDREPLLPFAVLGNRNFRLMSGVIISLTAAVGAMLLLLSLYLQKSLGMTAATAGLVLAVGPAISIAIAPVAGRCTDRLGGRGVLVLGLLLFTGGLIQVAVAASPGARWTALLPGLVLIGVAMGVTFAPPLTLAMGGIPPAVAGAASGALNTIRMFGVTVASAVVGAVVQDRTLHIGLTDALRLTFLVPAALLTVSIALTLAVRRTKRAVAAPLPDRTPTAGRI